MKIVFIGSGNVATHLATALHAAHHTIVQIYSRNPAHAQRLAQRVDAEAIHTFDTLCADADFYIFSIKDDALSTIIRQMPKNNGIWLHTAGSVSMDIFQDYTMTYGVLYPLQTFSINRHPIISEIPFFIEANQSDVTQKIAHLARDLSPKVYFLSSEKRAYLHLAAVFACNFVNHLYAVSKDILNAEGIDFDVLKPLIKETADKIQSLSPHEAQTGPAVRNDASVMEKHCNLLHDANHKTIYRTLSESIYSNFKQKKQ